MFFDFSVAPAPPWTTSKGRTIESTSIHDVTRDSFAFMHAPATPFPSERHVSTSRIEASRERGRCIPHRGKIESSRGVRRLAKTLPSSINLRAIEFSIIDGAWNSSLFDSEAPSRIISPYISLSVFPTEHTHINTHSHAISLRKFQRTTIRLATFRFSYFFT